MHNHVITTIKLTKSFNRLLVAITTCNFLFETLCFLNLLFQGDDPAVTLRRGVGLESVVGLADGE